MFETVQRHSLSESVYQQLAGRILRQELEPGEALPSERQLAEALGVNRGAVREAVKRLQQARLVAVRHGGNHTVQDYREHGGLEVLDQLLVDENGRVNTAVGLHIMAMRSALAPAVAAAAARHGTAELVGELRACTLAMRAADGELGELQEQALAFWSALIRGSGNLAFRLAFNSMNRSYRAVWALLRQVLAPELRRIDELQAIADAVEAKDPARAEQAARTYVAIGERAMAEALGGDAPR